MFTAPASAALRDPETIEQPTRARADGRPGGGWVHLGVLLVFTLSTIVATWPMFPQLGGFVITQDDPVQAIYEMAWQAHALATNPLTLLEANINYPFHSTLAFNEISFTEALLGAPLYALSGNPVLSHNAVILLVYILSGYGTWLLVRALTGSGWAGLVAGSGFAFSFFMINNIQHTTPVNAQWLPFLLLAAYKVSWTGRWRWVGALTLCFVLNALSSHYLAFYSAILLGLFFVYYFLFRRRLFTGGRLGQLAVGLGTGGLLVLPIAIPYAIVQGTYNFGRDLFQVERFSNTLVSFLAVYRANPLYRALLAPFADPGPWPVERSAFPGLIAPGLGVLALLWAVRRGRGKEARGTESGGTGRDFRLHVGFYAIVALVSAVLSLGPTLQLTYAADVYDPSTVQGVLPLPYLIPYYLVPGFASMRVATRVDVLLALALGVLAGLGALIVLRWLRARLAGWGGVRWVLPATAALLALLPVAETWSAPFPMYPIATRGAVPPVYRWLGTQPRSVILEYPMALKERGAANVAMQNLIQYYSVYHWQPMVNGSVTIRPYAYTGIIHETEDCFPCPRSVDALWLLGVQYVVVHLDNLTEPQRTEFLWRSTSPVGKVLDSFVLVQDFGADQVYAIKGPVELAGLRDLIRPGVPILLGAPERDPIAAKDAETGAAIGGGYMAALGWYLQDHPLIGDARLSFGQPIAAPNPGAVPPYALLWVGQDPASLGYMAQDRLWANEFVALYQAATGP